MQKRFLVGFTIVELLIVIVVIGILAGITTVSYAGVQSRAHDTRVQSNISTLADALNAYYVANSYKYPVDQTSFMTMTSAKVSTDSYVTTNNAMLYCVQDSTGQTMAIVGQSKTGNTYYIKDDGKLQAAPTNLSSNNPTSICSSLGLGSSSLYVWVHTTAGGWLSNVK